MLRFHKPIYLSFLLKSISTVTLSNSLCGADVFADVFLFLEFIYIYIYIYI